MEYTSNGKTIKKRIKNEKRHIDWVKLADDEWLVICVNYSEPLLDKANKLLKSKGIELRPAAGKFISYRYVCIVYIASKNNIFDNDDKKYVEKIIKKNEVISKVD